MTMNEFQSSSPKNQRQIKTSICLSSCCFSMSSVHHEALESGAEDEGDRVRTPRSPYAWLKSTPHELPEIRDRCRSLLSRLGRSRRNHHTHNGSSDFSYDLSSYALNFEDGYRQDDDEVSPLRNFLSRLPMSPPPAKYVSDSAAVRREIVGLS